jgi:molybdopterin-containing oxidoreductase family iron-sulfur binding subunit
MKRREFFKIMGIASGAALAACNTNNADRTLLPYLVPPEDDIIPGVPRFVRTTCTECPAMCGLNVKIRDDKPVKLEGNPDHPVNKGALCIRGQASLARLYHPDRFKQPLLKDETGTFKPVSWEEAIKALDAAVAGSGSKDLRNVWLSSRTSGSLSDLIDEFCKERNVERLKEVEIFNHSAVKQANKEVFNLAQVPHYRIDTCDVLVTLGADLFETFISPVEWTKQYIQAKKNNHTRWHHVEPYLSVTGASADSRSAIKPGAEAVLLAYLLRNLPHQNPLPESLLNDIPSHSIDQVVELTGLAQAAVKGIEETLKQAKQPLVISGGPATANRNGSVTARYTALLQWALGMVGKTVDFRHALTDETVGTFNDLATYVGDAGNDRIGVTLFSRLYGAAVMPGLLDSMKKVPFKVALAQVPDVMTEQCDLVLPVSHALESWGDASPRKGLKSVLQPVIKPQHDSKSEGDILLSLMGKKNTYRDWLADRWQGMGEEWINSGFKTEEMEVVPVQLAAGTAVGNPGNVYAGESLFIVPSLRTFDGRGSDITLLEEIPDPMTSVSYGKYVSVSLQEAKTLNLSPGDTLKVETAAGTLTLAAAVNPGLPGAIRTLAIDALHDLALPFDKESGQLQTCFEGVKLTRTGDASKLAVLSGAVETGKRGILPHSEPEDDHHHKYKRYTMYEPHEHKDYRWGLVIDLDACTGCSACVAACYIENNIPITGKKEHLKGREMSWLRIETYYNDPEKPEFLPMMCQQCDNAPCEPVCPVYATYHNPEGLNAQVYYRCVGTRYCSLNCPYKVRRFNWFNNENSLPLYQVSNPDLSVRTAGIMEKCSFCIQRIRFAKDQAKDEKRLVKDGEVIPACAQTCPAGAITFGNLMDPNSKVSKLAKSERAYRVLEAVGAEPAVYYIKRNKEKKT